jgi:hypothetical protein
MLSKYLLSNSVSHTKKQISIHAQKPYDGDILSTSFSTISQFFALCQTLFPFSLWLFVIETRLSSFCASVMSQVNATQAENKLSGP